MILMKCGYWFGVVGVRGNDFNLGGKGGWVVMRF